MTDIFFNQYDMINMQIHSLEKIRDALEECIGDLLEKQEFSQDIIDKMEQTGMNIKGFPTLEIKEIQDMDTLFDLFKHYYARSANREIETLIKGHIENFESKHGKIKFKD